MCISLLGIIGLALFFALIGATSLYLYMRRSLKHLINVLIGNIIMYWYVMVFSVTTIFVIANYDDCINLHFTSEFNGKNLIFLFWLAIIIFPFFDSFEAFGVSLKKRKEEKKAESYRKSYENLIANADYDTKE